MTPTHIAEAMGKQVPPAPASAYFLHARDILRGRWKEKEPYILQEPHIAVAYAKQIINGRWPELERVLLSGEARVEYLVDYALDVIKGRWPEAEPIIIESSEIGTPLLYARHLQFKWPALEKRILSGADEDWPVYITRYARDVIESRWPEGEKALLTRDKGLHWIWNYTKKVLRTRWLEAEKALLASNDDEGCYTYAYEVIGGRWPELEQKWMDKTIKLSQGQQENALSDDDDWGNDDSGRGMYERWAADGYHVPPDDL